MMTSNPGSIGSGSLLFACGHENPVGNRYCDTCGAARTRRCPICNSPNRDAAKFCASCGVRLQDEGAVRATITTSPTARRYRGTPVTGTTTAPSAKESPPGSDSQLLDDERPRWSERSGWRPDDVLSSPIDDVTVEEGWGAEDRRRKPFLLAAAVALTVAIAIVLAVGLLGPRDGGFLGRPLGWLADRGLAPVTRGGQPSDPTSTDPSATSPTQEPQTAGPRAAMSPSAPEATQAPEPPSAAKAPATTPPPPLPARSRSEGPAAPVDQPSSRGTPQTLVARPQTSEERMAHFLTQQLGHGRAAEKALANAAWYDAGRSEHSYWEGVAEAIRRRGER